MNCTCEISLDAVCSAVSYSRTFFAWAMITTLFAAVMFVAIKSYRQISSDDSIKDQARQKAKRRARELILKLAAQTDKDYHIPNIINDCEDKIFTGLAMAAAMQGRTELLFDLLHATRSKLDHRQLLKAAFTQDALCRVNRQLMCAGLLTLNEARELVWVQPTQEQRQKVAQLLVDDFIRVIQKDFKEPAQALKELAQFCQARDFSLPYLYLQNARLAW